MMSYFDYLSLSMAILAALTLIVSVDDVIVDSLYWLNKLGLTFNKNKHSLPKLTINHIQSLAEQPIAIMVPAWHEQDVIAKMIQHLADNIDYQSYQVFIGTYPNDIETIAEVERIKKHYPQVHRIEVPHDGPTSKADCLNAIYQGILHNDIYHEYTFQGYLLHDSEDVVHPLELKLFNALLPHYALIQIPVRAIAQSMTSFISGTYMDEFAEWHTKDIVVRALLTGIVPSAGVGTCFSRNAMSVASDQGMHPPFNNHCMTEDYDISLRIGLHGLPTAFALLNVPYSDSSINNTQPLQENKMQMRPLAVQEYFPDTLKTAYKQKARWTLGIGLQGWQNLGWKGTFLSRYFLYRDRKSLVTPLITIAAYIVTLQLMILTFMEPQLFQQITQPSMSWLPTTYIILSMMLMLRLAQRMYFVAKCYHWRQAFMVLPRIIVNNVINFLAVCRAWRLFLCHLLFHHFLFWDKTTHQYPETAKKATNKALLSLLTRHDILSDEDVRIIPRHIQQDSDLLTNYLYMQPNIDQAKLGEIIAYHAGLPMAYLAQYDIVQLKKTLPEEAYQWTHAIPFKLKENGYLCLATSTPLSPTALTRFSEITHYPVEQYIAPLKQIQMAQQSMR